MTTENFASGKQWKGIWFGKLWQTHKLGMIVFSYVLLIIYFVLDYCDAGTVTIAKLWTGLPCTTSTRTRRSLQRL
jgi:hypothetical protein